jgi:hypothetical protein
MTNAIVDELSLRFELLATWSRRINWSRVTVPEVQAAMNNTLAGPMLTKLIQSESASGVGQSVKIPVLDQDIFEAVSTFKMPVLGSRFSVRENINSHSKQIRFYGIDKGFTDRFEMIIEPRAGYWIMSWELLQNNNIRPKVPQCHFIDPYSFYQLLLEQSQGPNSGVGELLTDGHANIFQMIDATGDPMTVTAYWNRGWNVGLTSMDNLYHWYQGGRLFLRVA